MILEGDVLDKLFEIPSKSVQMVCTSPPYWSLRDYEMDDQFGLEPTPEEYVVKLVAVFRGISRILKKNGTVWLNLGDSYANTGVFGKPNEQVKVGTRNLAYGRAPTPPGMKAKNLIGIPWKVAFALQQDGWYLRQEIIWNKPNAMPEAVTDRCTKSHESIFLLAHPKSGGKYYYNADAIREPHLEESLERTQRNWDGKRDIGNIKPSWNNIDIKNMCHPLGKNKRSVWTINTQASRDEHFAVFPPKIPELCIKAGSQKGDTVLDPFFGSGTTGSVAQRLDRKWIGIELNPKYVKLAKRKFAQVELFYKESKIG